jgi:hypothetical protein
MLFIDPYHKTAFSGSAKRKGSFTSLVICRKRLRHALKAARRSSFKYCASELSSAIGFLHTSPSDLHSRHVPTMPSSQESQQDFAGRVGACRKPGCAALATVYSFFCNNRGSSLGISCEPILLAIRLADIYGKQTAADIATRARRADLTGPLSAKNVSLPVTCLQALIVHDLISQTRLTKHRRVCRRQLQ